MVNLPDGRVMLFGGEDIDAELLNDMHAFENNNWNPVTPNNYAPPARKDHRAWVRGGPFEWLLLLRQ